MFYLLVAICSLLVVWKWLKNSDSSEPPALPGNLPFIGHAHRILGDSVKLFEFIKQTSIEGVEKGGVVKLHLGPRMFYVVIDPEDCFTVLNECINKHYLHNFAKPLISNGIMNADVPTWKKHRKLLNPAFSQHVLDSFIGIFNSQAEKLVSQFAKEVGKPFNQEAYFRINNLETICATSLGATSEEYGDLQKQYLPALDEVLHIFNIRFQKFWLHTDFMFNMSSYKKRQDDLVEQLNQFSEKLIQKKRKEMFDSSDLGTKSGKFKPFIDLVTELGKDHPSMTDWHIRGETSTIVLGGHDTSASALTIALTLLGSHPQVQEKAYREILEVLGDSKYVDKEDLSKLVYIEAIVKETLRLYPSALGIARQLDKDIKLKNYTLKAGYGCVVSVYGSQRHPMWGPDADEFRPERWFEKHPSSPLKYFAAFGLARRACIGKTYAMMTMKVTLAHLIRSYIISSDASKLVLGLATTIRPMDGFHIALQHRP